MKIVFDDDAIEELRGIRAWIAKDSPRAAAQLLQKIFHKIDNLQNAGADLYGKTGPRSGEPTS
jgi:plasmid stabilization system protein ParE